MRQFFDGSGKVHTCLCTTQVVRILITKLTKGNACVCTYLTEKSDLRTFILRSMFRESYREYLQTNNYTGIYPLSIEITLSVTFLFC